MWKHHSHIHCFGQVDKVLQSVAICPQEDLSWITYCVLSWGSKETSVWHNCNYHQVNHRRIFCNSVCPPQWLSNEYCHQCSMGRSFCLVRKCSCWELNVSTFWPPCNRDQLVGCRKRIWRIGLVFFIFDAQRTVTVGEIGHVKIDCFIVEPLGWEQPLEWWMLDGIGSNHGYNLFIFTFSPKSGIHNFFFHYRQGLVGNS